MQSDLGIQLHVIPAQPADGSPDTLVPTVPWVGDMVCHMSEVQQAAGARLELWWQQWADAEDAPSLLHKYACWFKHRDHLGSKNHYMYNLSLPKQLQRQLLLLRTFNLKIGVHLHKFNASISPSCRHCGLPEDELHVLHNCPAYNVLRVVHGIPSTPDVDMFDTLGPMPIARYMRACLKLPEHDGNVSSDTELEEESDDDSDFGSQDGSFAERALRAQQYAQRIRRAICLALTARGWQGAMVVRFLFLVLFVSVIYCLVTHMGLGCLPG
jgi:hypothetical protein